MTLFKIVSFFTGYVTVIIQGTSPEKFINMASGRRIWLWNIQWINSDKITASVRLDGAFALRHIARTSGCRISFGRRCGLPFLISGMRRRKAMAAGGLLFVLMLYMLCSLVWFVEITGNISVKDEKIREVVREAGLSPGTLKWNLDTSLVSGAVENNFSEIAWAGVHVKGTRVVVEVIEKKLPPKVDDTRPAHVVAEKDALIEEVLVLKGNIQVEEGQAVKEGDILISGIIPPYEPGDEGEEEEKGEITGEEDFEYVHARGIVRARTWYEGYGESMLVDEGVRRTGNNVTQYSVVVGNKKIILSGPENIEFDKYDKDVTIKKLPGWRNITVPVEINIEQYFELKSYKKEKSIAEARKEAKEKAVSDAREHFTEEDKIVKILKTQAREINPGHSEKMVRMKVIIEVLEEIGREKFFNS